MKDGIGYNTQLVVLCTVVVVASSLAKNSPQKRGHVDVLRERIANFFESPEAEKRLARGEKDTSTLEDSLRGKARQAVSTIGETKQQGYVATSPADQNPLMRTESRTTSAPRVGGLSQPSAAVASIKDNGELKVSDGRAFVRTHSHSVRGYDVRVDSDGQMTHKEVNASDVPSDGRQTRAHLIADLAETNYPRQKHHSRSHKHRRAGNIVASAASERASGDAAEPLSFSNLSSEEPVDVFQLESVPDFNSLEEDGEFNSVEDSDGMAEAIHALDEVREIAASFAGDVESEDSVPVREPCCDHRRRRQVDASRCSTSKAPESWYCDHDFQHAGVCGCFGGAGTGKKAECAWCGSEVPHGDLGDGECEFVAIKMEMSNCNDKLEDVKETAPWFAGWQHYRLCEHGNVATGVNATCTRSGAGHFAGYHQRWYTNDCNTIYIFYFKDDERVHNAFSILTHLGNGWRFLHEHWLGGSKYVQCTANSE
jgi:hypothetical protein